MCPVFHFYGDEGFKETWKHFLEMAKRDRQSVSELLRIWVDQYVRTKSPGNPQKPITAWVEGHPDKEALSEKELLDRLVAWAAGHRGEVMFRDIVAGLKELGYEPKKRAKVADDLAQQLAWKHIKVIRG